MSGTKTELSIRRARACKVGGKNTAATARMIVPGKDATPSGAGVRAIAGAEKDVVSYGIRIYFHMNDVCLVFILGQFLIHLEEAGDDIGLVDIFREVVSFQDCVIVGLVCFAEFYGHCKIVV